MSRGNEGRCDNARVSRRRGAAEAARVRLTATSRGGGARDQTARRPPTLRRRYKINTCFPKSDFDLSTPELGKLDGSC